MPKLYITEFSGVHYEPGASTQAPKVPAIAEQTVTFTTTTASAVFNTSTTLVRVVADAAGRLAFGTAPVATANSMYIAAGAAEFFAVNGASGVLKLAAHDGIAA